MNFSFNQDTSSLAVSTQQGYKVYSLQNGQNSQFKLLYQNTSISGGIQQVCMLYRSSLLAIVGQGSNTLFPAQSVVLFDDQSGRTISSVSINNKILDIQMTRQKIAIQTEKYIEIYGLQDMVKQIVLQSLPNSQFLLYGEKNSKIYYQKEPGVIDIYDLEQQQDLRSIKCHETMIKAFAVNDKYLYTMSEKGTLLRSFDLSQQSKRLEWRRGYTDCNVFSIAVSKGNNQYIATSSDHKTIHIVKDGEMLKSEQIKLDSGNWKLSWINDNQLCCVNQQGKVILLEVKEENDKKLIISKIGEYEI